MRRKGGERGGGGNKRGTSNPKTREYLFSTVWDLTLLMANFQNARGSDFTETPTGRKRAYLRVNIVWSDHWQQL